MNILHRAGWSLLVTGYYLLLAVTVLRLLILEHPMGETGVQDWLPAALMEAWTKIWNMLTLAASYLQSLPSTGQ